MPDDCREAAHSGPELDNRGAAGVSNPARGEIDRLIVAIAARQHGVITLQQLMAIGLSRRAIQWRISNGRSHPIHRGVYAVGRPDLTIKGRWMAAVLACGDGAVLSHRSAATLHGFLDARGGRIEVTIPRPSSLARPRLRVHRSTCLVPEDCVMVDRIPCTSVPATLLALAATAPTNVVQSACNKAEIMRLLDMRSIERLMDRRGAHPGSSQLRALLAVDDLGPGWTRSELEKRFLRLARETGLPAPTVNDSIAIPGEELQCDFVWHKQRVIVEVDGWETHRTRKAFHDDRRRDQLLQLVGWDVVRFTSDDLDRRPGQVVEVVSAMLERGLVARRPFAGSARDG